MSEEAAKTSDQPKNVPPDNTKERLSFEYIDTNLLVPYENNPRDNAAAVGPLSAAIDTLGFNEPIVIDEKNVILAGHTRLKSAQQIGMKRVPVIRVKDLTNDQKIAYRLESNKTAEIAKWKKDLLALEAEAIKDSGIDLAAFGFDTSALKDLLEQKSGGEEEPISVATVPPRAAPGQLWELGAHRLIVGDSTDKAVIARLMDGELADLWLTDPPYNVNYEGAAGKIQNDNLGDAQFRQFLDKAFSAANEVLRPGASGYVFHADGNTVGYHFRGAILDLGLEIPEIIIWKKNSFTLGRQDYQWQHEPALYVRKPGAAHYFVEDRTQSTVIDEPAPDLEKMTPEQMKALLKRIFDLKTNTTVLEFPKPKRNADHPTEKPVELFERLIKNSSKRDQIVLDTFCGSGTTVLAAEQTGRRARAVELDPKYASVIIERWERMTGLKAEKIG